MDFTLSSNIEISIPDIELLVNAFVLSSVITFDVDSELRIHREFEYFSEIINIETSDNIFGIINAFATHSLIELDTQSNIQIIGTSNIPVAPRKIQYLTDSLVPDNIHFNFPKYKEFIRAFLKYLDLTSIKSTVNILNNVNINYVYKEFIDDYLGMYLNEVLDLSKYRLTDENKRKILNLSRILHNLKGNKKSFDFLFRTLTNIVIANEDKNINIDRIVTEYIENEEWWNIELVKYYDAVYLYDGSQDHTAIYSKPFNYQFKIDQSRETMLPLIRALHPAGFNYEFLIEIPFMDDMSIAEVLDVKTRYFHFYSYDVPNMTNYYYNGQITHSLYHEVTTID